MSKARSELVAQISKATSLSDQIEAVAKLDAFDKRAAAAAQQERELDWASTTVEQTLTPVRVHSMHSMATEWLGDYKEPDTPNIQAIAKAAFWFAKTSPELRADPEEFAIQAEGFMRREASAFGSRADAVLAEGLQYVGFLWRQHMAASGLDQIQQTVDPNNEPKTTPLNPQVFDNFAPDVDPINAGVVGTETSERAPLLQEIEQAGAGQGVPEKPGGHSEFADYSNSYSEVPAGGNLDNSSGPLVGGDEAGDDDDYSPHTSMFTPSLAINQTMTLDDFRREAASGLPQIQETVDANNNPHAPSPLPTQVMFPWLIGPDAYGNGGPVVESDDDEGEPDAPKYAAKDDSYGECPGCGEHKQLDEDGVCANCEQYKAPKSDMGPNSQYEDYRDHYQALLNKQADMFPSDGGTPAQYAQSEQTANTPQTTPNLDAGRQEGLQDALNEQRPTFADNSSNAAPNVKEYSEGYSDGVQERQPQKEEVPSLRQASRRFVKKAVRESPDFRKGYGFVSKWASNKPLVSIGSPQFEEGLFAGLVDNPGKREAWRAAHRRLATRDESFATRIAQQDAYSDYLFDQGIDVTKTASDVPLEIDPEDVDADDDDSQSKTAATSDFLDTSDPRTSPSPTGQTFINGPGTVPVLNGQDTSSDASGGPAPYNGAEPYGSPVVPTSPAMPSPVSQTINDLPGGPVDQNRTLAAFRQTIQANLNKKG